MRTIVYIFLYNINHSSSGTAAGQVSAPFSVPKSRRSIPGEFFCFVYTIRLCMRAGLVGKWAGTMAKAL